MKIIGCKLSFEVESDILYLISTDDIEFSSIIFEKEKEQSIMKGVIFTSNLSDSYNYILFELKNLIIKVLLITKGIDNLRIEDEIEFCIINKKEIIEKGLPVEESSVRFMTINPKIKEISQEEFEENVKEIYKIDDKTNEMLFWQYLSYSIPDIKKGKTKFDFISQYRLIWSSFNSLYKQLSNKKNERKSLEEYSKKDYVIKYFSDVVKDNNLYIFLERLIEQDLYLKYGEENVSKKLIKSIEKEEQENISKYSILCLYAIRNSIIHGSSKNEINLCREGFTLLNPLVKITFKKEILKM